MSAIRRVLTPAEWRRVGGMTLVIVSLNAAGWGIYFLAIQPRHFHYQGLGIGLGVAIPASPN